MKNQILIVLMVLLAGLSSCEKSSLKSYNDSSQGELYSFEYVENAIIDTTQTIGVGDTIWYEFDAYGNDLYNISWVDAIVTTGFDLENESDPTYSSIQVSIFHENKTDYYFKDIYLIQTDGSPFTIIPSSDEKIYIEITSRNQFNSGKFDFKVDQLIFNSENSQILKGKHEITVNPGETKIFGINAEQYETYELYLNITSLTGAYGDCIEVNTAGYFETTENELFYDAYCRDKTFEMQAADNGIILVIMSGAYWWEPATIEIELMD